MKITDNDNLVRIFRNKHQLFVFLQIENVASAEFTAQVVPIYSAIIEQIVNQTAEEIGVEIWNQVNENLPKR